MKVKVTLEGNDPNGQKDRELIIENIDDDNACLRFNIGGKSVDVVVPIAEVKEALDRVSPRRPARCS